VFNVADSCICVGGALIVLMAILGRDYDGGVARRRRLAEIGKNS
jgi:signal peptidase II